MALLDIVKKGSTDRSVPLAIVDSGDGTPETGVVFNTSGIDLWYRREGEAVTSVTEATLAALTTAHTDGGFLHVGHGVYRFDLPDAAFATGANYVDIGGTVTGMVVFGGRVRLVDYDPENAVRLGLTALPNAAADAAGGLPISDAGGLDLDAKLAATNEVTAARMGALTDWINGGRLDLLLDAALADTNELQTDWANGGRLDLILDARASQTSVDTIDDFLDAEIAAILAAVDTEVAAIKTQTDKLTFTVANQLDANIQSINDASLTGDGTSGTPWGPA